MQLPKTAAEEVKVKEILAQTAGFVVQLRKVYRNTFQAFAKGAAESVLSKEPLTSNFVGFSDSFVTSVPLRNDCGDLARMVTVFSALSAAATVMLTSLASKHPLRGGIDVGLATEIGPEEIYGTALERAYLLECKVAQYPRIVIGDEFWKYLNSALVEFGKEDGAIAALVKKIMKFISVDTDGKRILDYLGPTMVEIAAPQYRDIMVQPAYDFLLMEQNQVQVNGDAELIQRYVSFRSYFESRLPLWNISLSKD